jgi:hypothetical protein
MAHGTVSIKLRPIKLAFLVGPAYRAGLLEAIEINTFLWGGMFNPIIPAFRHMPKAWQDKLSRNVTSKEIIAGYVDAYDPDYIVEVGGCSSFPFDIGSRLVISSSEILADVSENGIHSTL